MKILLAVILVAFFQMSPVTFAEEGDAGSDMEKLDTSNVPDTMNSGMDSAENPAEPMKKAHKAKKAPHKAAHKAKAHAKKKKGKKKAAAESGMH